MNPYLLAIKLTWSTLGIFSLLLWAIAGATSDEHRSHPESTSHDDVMFMVKAALIPTVLLIIAVLTLPFLANNWDCDNATHPGERPCEVHGER